MLVTRGYGPFSKQKIIVSSSHIPNYPNWAQDDWMPWPVKPSCVSVEGEKEHQHCLQKAQAAEDLGKRWAQFGLGMAPNL